MDHYEILDVEADSDREAIRESRTQLISAIDERLRNPKTKDRDRDALRRQKGDINAAWAVLADPYQRERYDAGRATAEGADATSDAAAETDESSADEASSAATTSAPAKSPSEMSLRERWRAGMESAPKGAALPARLEPAPVMKRLGAVVMDLVVMAAYFLALGGLAANVADDDNMVPAAFVWGALALSLGFLIAYNVLPVVRSGRTLGHRLVGLAVVNVDTGEFLGWRYAFRRYTVVILLAAIAPLAPGNVFQMAALLVGLSFLFSKEGVSLLDRFGRSRVVIAPQ